MTGPRIFDAEGFLTALYRSRRDAGRQCRGRVVLHREALTDALNINLTFDIAGEESGEILAARQRGRGRRSRYSDQGHLLNLHAGAVQRSRWPLPGSGERALGRRKPFPSANA